jgi:hypothetical protein
MNCGKWCELKRNPFYVKKSMGGCRRMDKAGIIGRLTLPIEMQLTKGGHQMEQLEQLVNSDTRLVWKGRFIDTSFLVEVGDIPYLVKISEGRVASVRRGPFVMPSWTFAMRASRDTWDKFWLPVPPPGSNDLFALIKRRALKIEGNLHPFMANLFYFKGVMAALRLREAK